MSNATIVEAFALGCLCISLGCWIHWLRTPPADTECRTMALRLAVGMFIGSLLACLLIVLLWERLNSLHTVTRSQNPAALIFVVAVCATFAVLETGTMALQRIRHS